MADIAQLGFSADTSDLADAKAKLEAIVPAAAKAEKAATGVGKGLERAAADAQRASVELGKIDAAAEAAAGGMMAETRATEAASGAINKNTSEMQRMVAGLRSVKPASDAAAAGIQRVTKTANDNAGAMKANVGNIAAQFQDIGVTAAMGMSPMMIALQQGTQLAGVFAQTGGNGFKAVGSAIASVISPASILTIGLVALVSTVIQLGVAWFNSGSEADRLAEVIGSLKTASDGVSDAQSILGKVFDLTTGKMKVQTAAAVNLARAQLLLMKATAQSNISKASAELDGAGNLGFFGRAKAFITGDRALIEGSARVDMLTKALKNNQITGADALKGFQMLLDRGQITNEMFLKGSVAAANYGAEIENVKTAVQGLSDLETGKLSSIFLDPKKERQKKGGKTAAQKLSDVFDSARADIAIEKARGLAEANNVGAYEAARLQKETALLNAVQQKGLPITDAVRKSVAGLADEYAKAKTAADVSAAINGITTEIDNQRAAIADQAKLTGLYGDALARATREMEAQKKLRESIPKGEIAVVPNLTGGLSDDIEAQNRAERMAKLRKDSEDAAYAMGLEREGYRLTGAEAAAYGFVLSRLNEAKRAGIELSPDEIAAIKAAGDAYGEMRYKIDQQREALDFTRGATRGFIDDLRSGLAEGKSLWEAFGTAVINVLNKIIDKLLDSALDQLFSPGGGGGGILGAFAGLFGGGGGGGAYGVSGSDGIYAKGGAFGNRAQLFASGAAFSNSIVSGATPFAFGQGGSKTGIMGEAGPEAVMPLTRGPDGSLGVQMYGQGSGNAGGMQQVLVRVEAVEGDMFKPRVEAIAESKAITVTEAGLTQFNNHLPERFQQIANDERAR